MKFEPIELKKGNDYLAAPPVGAYVAEIMNARIVEASGNQRYNKLEMMIDITEGEFKGRFTEIYEDQKERGYDAKFKGMFRLSLPTQGQDNSKVTEWVSKQLFCVFDSNAKPGEPKEYRWDGDVKTLVGKKVGINVRRRLYNYVKDGETIDGETTEIGRLETISDVKAGRCKAMRDNDRREAREESTDGSSFTDVSKGVEVPWN